MMELAKYTTNKALKIIVRTKKRKPENNFLLNGYIRVDCAGSMPNIVKSLRIAWKIFIFLYWKLLLFCYKKKTFEFMPGQQWMNTDLLSGEKELNRFNEMYQFNSKKFIDLKIFHVQTNRKRLNWDRVLLLVRDLKSYLNEMLCLSLFIIALFDERACFNIFAMKFWTQISTLVFLSWNMLLSTAVN